ARPAREPEDPESRRGRDIFVESECVGCHTIRGVSESGTRGSDLTHLASRDTIAGVTLDLTRENLRAWIEDPDRFKPGVAMPPADLDGADLEALVTYLEGLR
ncbi:MAG: c-type cytochrome, partial [Actinomycetota bacterium]